VREDETKLLWFVTNNFGTVAIMPSTPPGVDLLTGKVLQGRRFMQPHEVLVIKECLACEEPA